MLRHKSDHPTKNCTMPDCERPLRARGLCGTHYNKQCQPNRHAKKLVACAWCGTEILKQSGGGRKYGQVCSNECRKWLATPYCPLPADHWARWYGRTSQWSPPKPRPEKGPRFTANRCDECGDSFIDMGAGNISTYCSRTCSRRVGRRARKAREHDSPGSYRWAEVIRLWIAAQRRCSYCDETMTEQPDPDHVIPISRGGRNDIGNIVPCCRGCNADKCDMTLSEWAIERVRLGKAPVRYDLDVTNPRFKHLTMGEATGLAWRHQGEFEACA